MFDNLGFGLNSRTQNIGNALESEEAAQKYIDDWWDQLIDNLDLPPKFFISGHSAGGCQAMWYISRHPERCAGIFLQSPAGTEDSTREGFDYEQYVVTQRKTSMSDTLPSKKEVAE